MFTTPQYDKRAIRWLEKLLAVSPDPAYFFDVKTHDLLAANHRCVQLLGFKWQELLGKKLGELRSPEDMFNFLETLKREQASGEAQCTYVKQDGAKLAVHLTYRDNFCMDSQGFGHHVCLVIVDATESEEKLAA
jgi:PAS domain-containing protein